MYTPLTTSYLNICFTESMECVFWTVIFTIKWTCDSHGNSESYLPCTLTFFISQEKQNLHGYLPQEKNLKSHAWKMAIFRAENGHFPGWDLPLDNDLFPPWKWPFPTLKMTIFHPEKSQAWKKAIFRVEFFFKKNFHRAGKWPKSLPKFKIPCLWPGVSEKSQGWKNLPKKMAIFHAWDLKIFSCVQCPFS